MLSTDKPRAAARAQTRLHPAGPARPQDTAAAARAAAEADQRSLAAERRRIEQDLRQALTQDGLTLQYQPRLTLATGTLVGLEALVRWPHRRRGMLSPAGFIPLAEQSGLITELGGWVLRTACQEATAWPAGPDRPAPTVSVNISPRQLLDGALLGQIAEALDRSGLPPDRLDLELTEQTLLEVDTESLLVLAAVRDLGIGLVLDDFGNGFASLAMLRRMPLSAMKLDRTLVRDLPDDADDVAIVRAALATAHALGLTVIAEGIETEAQRGFLDSAGCDEGQGYLFSAAMPAAELRRQLRG